LKRADDRAGRFCCVASEVAAYVALNGVTRCPTVALEPTTATIPTDGLAALRAHYEAQAAKRAEWAARRDRATLMRRGALFACLTRKA
jgi:hypothetical protein